MTQGSITVPGIESRFLFCNFFTAFALEPQPKWAGSIFFRFAEDLFQLILTFKNQVSEKITCELREALL